MIYSTTQTDLKRIMLSRKSQFRKVNILYESIYRITFSKKKKKIIEMKNRVTVSRELVRDTWRKGWV